MRLHKHHIIPKHMGGTDDPHNITYPILTIDHAIWHWVLFRQYGKLEDKIAWKGLMGELENPRSMICGKYERTDEWKKKVSEIQKNLNRDLRPLIEQSDWWKNKIKNREIMVAHYRQILPDLLEEQSTLRANRKEKRGKVKTTYRLYAERYCESYGLGIASVERYLRVNG